MSSEGPSPPDSPLGGGNGDGRAHRRTCTHEHTSPRLPHPLRSPRPRRAWPLSPSLSLSSKPTSDGRIRVPVRRLLASYGMVGNHIPYAGP